MNKKISIVIADDHTLFREGVASVLEDQFDVLGQAGRAQEALRLARELAPDLILLDIHMPVDVIGNGLQAVSAIAANCPNTKIVMLTISPDESDVLAALKAGARGYVSKGVSARELAGILQSVHQGESYVTPALAANLLLALSGAHAHSGAVATPLEELTDRERQVLGGVSEGLSNKEIALRTHLSEKTVKHYVSNVLQKLHVRNRVEAALLVQRGHSTSG